MGLRDTQYDGIYLLRRVDPYNVQVAEVDALLVQESGAGAALGAHMGPLGDGGGRGGLSSRRW